MRAVVRGPQPTEAEFQAAFVELARALGWRCNHTRRAIGKGRTWTTATSIVGWPDLTCGHAGQRRLIFVELKSAKGKVSEDQSKVLRWLQDCGQEVFVLRPDDWDRAVEILRGAR